MNLLYKANRSYLFYFFGAVLAILLLLPLNASAQMSGLSAAAGGLELSHLPAPPPLLSWRIESTGRISKVLTSEFQSQVPSPYPKNQIVPIWVYLPNQSADSNHNYDANQRFPFVLILHYLGAVNLDSEISLAHRLNERGIAGVIIALPYHLSRTPNGYKSGQLAVVPNGNEIIRTMIQSVWDSREAVMAAEQLPQISPENPGITGISLGSLVAENVYALEPQIQHAAFVLGGCDLAATLWNSQAVVGVKYKFLQKNVNLSDLKRKLACIEPSFYLKSRIKTNEPKHSALVISAEFDQVIPRFSSDLLIQSLNDPFQIRIDTGHYGGAFVQSRLVSEVANYFEGVDSGLGYKPPKVINAPTLRLAAQAMIGTGFDIGVGVDIFRTHQEEPFFGSFVLSPRGAEIFMGKNIGNDLSIGVVGGTRGLGYGIFWSSIL